MSAQPPAVRRVDRGQLAVLLRVTLWEMLRPGVDAHTGARHRPLRQLVFAMSFIGALFATNVGRVVDERSYLVLLFALAMSTVLLGVAPESYEARVRKLEILYSKPIATRTFLAVRALVLLLLAALIITCLALPPLLVGGLRFGGWGRAAAAYVTLLAGGFALVVLWLALFARLAARVGLGPLRMLTQTALALVVLAVAGLTLSALPARLLDGAVPEPISLDGSRVARWLPSTWFVELLYPADGSLVALAERGAALALVAAALALLAWADVDPIASLERLTAPPAPRMRQPLAVRLFVAMRHLPLIGPRWAGGPVGALATLMLTVSGREEISRLKALTPRLLQVVMFVLAVRSPEQSMFLVLLAYFGLMGLIEGILALRQSADAAATWLLHLAPLDGAALLRGVRRAAIHKHFLFPALLLAAASLRAHPPQVAAVLCAGYLALGSSLVAGSLLVAPRLPLAEEPSTTPGIAGFAVATVFGLGALLAFVTFLAVVTLLGWIGVVLGAMAAFTLLLAAHLGGHFAGRRLRALEYRW